MFVRVNTHLKASHLYARTLDEANSLRRRLDAGEIFEDLAKEVFADPELARSGGSVGYFGFDEMYPQFEEAAYAMQVGEVSQPVQTATGFSIIRLEDRKVHPLLTEYEFATRRDRIETYVTYRKRLDARQALRNAILDEVSPQIEDRAVELFVESASEIDTDSWSTLANEELTAATIRVGDDDLSVAQLLDEARFMDDRQLAAAHEMDRAREILKGLIVRLELLDRARRAGITRIDSYRDAMESARRRQLYEGAWNHFRATTALADDSLRTYFGRHGAEFVVPERLRVWEIVVESNERAVGLLSGLSQSNFSAVAALHSMRPGADETGGDLGYVTREQMGILADPVFAAKRGTLLGPLEAMGRYAIFLIGDRQAPRPATFDEARSKIEARLISDAVRAAVEDRIAAIRQHYYIERFPDRAESIELRKRVST
jgi:parvulin-like peptidyl-prolyl isomerase